jgi:membrane protein
MPSSLPEQTETPESDPPDQPDQPELSPQPIEDIKPVVTRHGLGAEIVALVRYMARTEVHTYAFSVAANAILCLFPFIVLLLTISRNIFHSRSMEQIVGDMMKNLLPVGQDFVMRNMQLLTHPRKDAQFFSVVMLLITSTGVFLPLEVALNRVWGVRRNRSYLHNQAVSLGLALAVGVLAMASVASTASQQTILSWIFLNHTDNFVFRFISYGFLRLCAGLASILLFFLIYWVLPYRKIPARAVLPTAVVIGLLWQLAKVLYIRALPWLDFQSIYGPFYISVGLMMWAFISGLLLLAGAHFSATRYTLRLAREAEREEKAAVAKSE